MVGFVWTFVLGELLYNLTQSMICTLCCPVSQGAVVVNDVVEGQGDDEEGAVAGRVHLKRHIALVQPHRLALLGQRRL